MVGKVQQQEREGAGYTESTIRGAKNEQDVVLDREDSGCIPGDPLPPTMLCFLKIPEPSKAEDQLFKHTSLWETFQETS